MSEQKFTRGNVVRVADDLGECMRHFRAGGEAVVIGSYRDQYGGADEHSLKSYTLMFLDTGSRSSWYDEHQLTLVDVGGEHVIRRREAANIAEEVEQADLGWIVANWPRIRDNVPGYSICHLMKLVGITDPWGKHGEGYTYYMNARWTFEQLDDALSSGNVALAEYRIAEVAADRSGRPR